MAEKRKLAFYIRLSDADEEVKAGTKDESNSITGQRKLLYAYIKKTEEFAGFEVLEYFDDGYSGTMFNNRAEFQRLIQDAELGRFECIIVKDFSRFGRDYIGVGDYLEQIFPIMGVRVIAINSQYDSNNYVGKTMGLEMSITNLVNTLYSRDLSKKYKSCPDHSVRGCFAQMDAGNEVRAQCGTATHLCGPCQPLPSSGALRQTPGLGGPERRLLFC